MFFQMQDESELVRPLEEEIKVLKEKLRDTDSQLQLALVSFTFLLLFKYCI